MPMDMYYIRQELAIQAPKYPLNWYSNLSKYVDEIIVFSQLELGQQGVFSQQDYQKILRLQ